MRHRSEIAARLVYVREISRTAFWEFCNSISGKPDRVRLDAPVGGSGWPNELNASAMTARNIAKALWLQRQAPARGRGQATMSYEETPRVGVDPKQ
jgi:hypothetical protein